MHLPKQTPLVIALLVIAVLAAACPRDDNGDDNGDGNGNGDPLPPGLRVFLSSGCASCHTIDSVPQARGEVGPNLSNIGGRADADYIRESILDPNAVIVDGFAPDIMPQTFGEFLSEDDLDALVQYLSSLAEALPD